MASLEPVYQKVDTKDPESAPEEIELEDLSKKDTCAEQKSKCAEKCQSKCKKSQRVRRCMRCLSVGCCLIFMATIFVSAIVIGVVVHKVRGCVYPSIQNVQSFTYEPTTIDQLSFDIATGSVTVHTCDHAKNVTVKVTLGAKTEQLLKEIVVDVKEAQKSLSFTAQTASFDTQHCQIIHVEVVIPSTSTHPISLSASAGVGLIRFHTKSYTFNNVNLKVNVGGIKLSHLDAQTLTSTVSVGGVAAREMKVEQDLSVHVDHGATCLHQVDASKTTIEVGTGFMRVRELDASSISAKVDYGVTSLIDILSPYTESELNYGRMWVSPKKEFGGVINFYSTYGRFDVTSARNVNQPPINIMSSKQQSIALNGPDGKPGIRKMDLKTTNGNVNVYLGHCNE